MLSLQHRWPSDWWAMICPRWSMLAVWSTPPLVYALTSLQGGFAPWFSQAQRWGLPACSSSGLPFSFSWVWGWCFPFSSHWRLRLTAMIFQIWWIALFLLMHLKLLVKTTLSAQVCQLLQRKCHRPSWWYYEITLPSILIFPSWAFMWTLQIVLLCSSLETYNHMQAAILSFKGKAEKRRKKKKKNREGKERKSTYHHEIAPISEPSA